MSENKKFRGMIIWEILFFVVIFVLLFLVFNPVIFTGGDNGYYIGLSHSIMKDFSYKTFWKVGTPAETAIPPGYPLILATIQSIFGEGFLPMKAFSLICFLVGLIFLYKILTMFDVNRFIAGGAVFFMALSPVINEYSHWILTEAPFLCIAAIGIYFIERYIEQDSEKLKNFIIGAVIIVIAVYVRIPAVTILPAVFFYIWLKKDLKKALIFAAIVFVLLLPWGLRVLLTSSPEGNLYLQSLTQKKLDTGVDQSVGITGLLKRIPEHFWKYSFEKVPGLMIPQRYSNANNTWVNNIIGPIVLIPLLLGFYYSYKKKQFFSSFFIIFTMGLLLINHSVRIRYLIILFPFIIHVMIMGIEFIFVLFKSEKAKKLANFVMGVLLLTIIVFASIVYIPNAKLNLQVMKIYAMGNEFAGLHPVYLRYFDCAEWVRENTDEDALIIARKPRLFYITSHRKSDIFVKNEDTKMVIDDIIERDIDYCIIDRVRAETGMYLIPALESRKDLFEVVHVTGKPESYVVKVKKGNVR